MTLADNFRMPYWDWARKTAQVIPQEAIDPGFRVKGPLSKNSVSGPDGNFNPLFRFKFPKDTPVNITVCLSESRGYHTVFAIG